jgi:hypothetical protein
VSGDVQHAGDANFADVEGGVWGAVAGHLLGGPAHNVGVELAGGFGVAGHQLIPAELSFGGKHGACSDAVVYKKYIACRIKLFIPCCLPQNRGLKYGTGVGAFVWW